jgi:predicted acyl esterase
MVFPTAYHVFRPGHAVRLEIASSCFPLFDRNPNTGAPSWRASPVEFCPATQLVLHDAAHPSSLVLPR